eukprot:TRINITY_DN11_c0_g1_i2.p1 TRINITY_DN11_c0_g1~~TRINITY_DN11_c0_g1_i2.p1  ORF type:complete len:255 (+),score=16.88 TRINITY_DN11_c0_g1_i2:755-1519(+)
MDSTKGAYALLRLASVLLLVLPAWAVAPIQKCPVGPPIGVLPSDALQRGATNDIPGIKYNGGPVMTKPINVYFIWYGLQGFSENQKSVLRNLVASYSDSSNVTSEEALQGGAPSVRTWWGVETEYYDKKGHVTSTVRLAREYSDTTASQGTDKPDIGAVVKTAVSSGGLPIIDSNGFYVVFTDLGVYVDGFCTEHCGWHTYQILVTPISLENHFTSNLRYPGKQTKNRKNHPLRTRTHPNHQTNPTRLPGAHLK